MYKKPKFSLYGTSKQLKGIINIRPILSILEMADLYYCIHWSLQQCEIDGNIFPVEFSLYVIQERRRALDWCLSHDMWDEVSTDT